MPPDPVLPPRRWVHLVTLHREDEAALLAGRLQSEGIDARTDPPLPLGSYYGSAIEVQLLRGIQVLVPEEEVETARASLREVEG